MIQQALLAGAFHVCYPFATRARKTGARVHRACRRRIAARAASDCSPQEHCIASPTVRMIRSSVKSAGMMGPRFGPRRPGEGSPWRGPAFYVRMRRARLAEPDDHSRKQSARQPAGTHAGGILVSVRSIGQSCCGRCGKATRPGSAVVVRYGKRGRVCRACFGGKGRGRS